MNKKAEKETSLCSICITNNYETDTEECCKECMKDYEKETCTRLQLWVSIQAHNAEYHT